MFKLMTIVIDKRLYLADVASTCKSLDGKTQASEDTKIRDIFDKRINPWLYTQILHTSFVQQIKMAWQS